MQSRVLYVKKEVFQNEEKVCFVSCNGSIIAGFYQSVCGNSKYIE